jgi:hypothetical protein
MIFSTTPWGDQGRVPAANLPEVDPPAAFVRFRLLRHRNAPGIEPISRILPRATD